MHVCILISLCLCQIILDNDIDSKIDEIGTIFEKHIFFFTYIFKRKSKQNFMIGVIQKKWGGGLRRSFGDKMLTTFNFSGSKLYPINFIV